MTSLYPAETNSGVVTSWVPLTTTFTAPASCANIYRQDGYSYVAYDPGYGLDVNRNIICQPPAVTTWWEQGRLGFGGGSGHTAASLGPMTCPDEWTTVATSVKDVGSTAAMCCPSGFYLENGIDGSIAGNCLSDVTSGWLGTWAFTDDGSAWSTSTQTVTGSSTVGAIGVVGWNIKQTSSSSSTTTEISASSISSQASSPLVSVVPVQTSASPSEPASPATDEPAGLSSGAAIGIGVGVASGVIGITALLAALYLIRRRKNKKSWLAEGQANNDAGSSAPEHVQQQVGDVGRDTKSWWPHELDGNGARVELQSHSIREPAELAGS